MRRATTWTRSSLAGLTRDQVYIANVIKCRPPSNRNPRPEEIEACSPFLREQIRSVWPDVLVCLGNFATQFVLRTEMGVTHLRGHLYQTGHFAVVPTFHRRHACTTSSGSRFCSRTSPWWARGCGAHPREEDLGAKSK